MKTIRTILLVLCLLSLTVSLAGAQSGINVTITDLGTLEGGDSLARAINDLGQWVGSSDSNDGKWSAILWTEESGIINLGTLGDDFDTGNPYDINELGEIVGYSSNVDGSFHAFLWTEETGMIDLGSLGGHFYSFAFGINNLSQVVGVTDTTEGLRRAFLWTKDAGMTDLGTLGGNESGARSINELGQVVGWSKTAIGDFHAFLWTADAGMTDLGTLGGNQSDAYAINNLGHVVGYSHTADDQRHAFLWTTDSGMIDLGTLGGIQSDPEISEDGALGINDLSQVIGRSRTANGNLHAFLWTAETGMIDLGTSDEPPNPSFSIFNEAFNINNFGQIVGWAGAVDGFSHATLWTIASASPEDQAQALVDQVNGFVAAGKLNDGQGNALITKVNNLLTQLAKDKPRVACNSLNAFTNQIQSFIDEEVLSTSDGQLLIQAADAIKTEVCP